MWDRTGFSTFFVIALLLLCAASNTSAEAQQVDTSQGPKLDLIMYNMIPDDDDQVQALLDNDIDLIGDIIDPFFIETLVTAEDIEIANHTRNGYGKMIINCAKYPFNYTSFRRALAFALDKEAITRDIWEGYAMPHDSLVSSCNPFSIEGQLPYDYYSAQIDTGNALLDEAGFIDVDDDGFREAPDGSDFDVLVEVPSVSSIIVELGGHFTDALEALQVDADWTTTDFYEYLNRLYFHGDYDIVFLNAIFDSFDIGFMAIDYATQYFDVPYYNFPNWMNSTYDDLAEIILHSVDYDEIYDAASEMQEIWVHSSPEIVCYENKLFTAYRTDRFTGFVNDANGGVCGYWTNYFAHQQSGGFGGVLRTTIEGNLPSLNFMSAAAHHEEEIHNQIWDSLFRIDPSGIDIPWLVESYLLETHEDNPVIPEGHTRFTFDLFNNITWRDGRSLTAEDVAFSLNYYRDGAGNPLGDELNDLTAVYATQNYRVVVEFDSESYWNLQKFAYLPIIPREDFQQTGVDDWYTWDPELSELNTSGAFYISDYVEDEFIELTRYHDYFRASTAMTDPSEPTTPTNGVILPTIPDDILAYFTSISGLITIASLTVIIFVGVLFYRAKRVGMPTNI